MLVHQRVVTIMNSFHSSALFNRTPTGKAVMIGGKTMHSGECSLNQSAKKWYNLGTQLQLHIIYIYIYMYIYIYIYIYDYIWLYMIIYVWQSDYLNNCHRTGILTKHGAQNNWHWNHGSSQQSMAFPTRSRIGSIHLGSFIGVFNIYDIY